MAKMPVGDEEKKELPVCRTSCCGTGAYGIIYGVYLVMKPHDPKPTQTAERIGGFRGCSKCFKPLADVCFRPGWDIPRSVWVQMLARVSPERGDCYGLGAYYAQRNADGTISLFDWTTSPTFRSLNARRELVGREANAMPLPPRESVSDRRNKMLVAAKEKGLFDGDPANPPEPKESPRIIEEEPPEDLEACPF